MVEIPVHNAEGKQVDALQVDEQTLGGEVRPALLKQAFVRYAANRRQGSAHTRNRAAVKGSNRKLYRQKGTGNARRGPSGTNLMRGGGHGFSKTPHSWRQGMPVKMRRLANRNAMLAKAIDGEIKVLDKLAFDQPSTRQFISLLDNLEVNRTCLVALADTRGNEARSAANVPHVSLKRIEHLNAFDLLNHRYLVVEKQALARWLDNAAQQAVGDKEAS